MQQTKIKIKIPYKYVVAAAYLYMVLPIVVFFFGWLKTGYSVLFSGFVLAGLFWILKEQFRSDESIRLPLVAVFLFIVVMFVWGYCSGVGGFWPQKADWHWRNAILRDLIDYSWPVVYPDTGNALVYYISYFLIPALAGKLLGWQAANTVLLLWTILGLSICVLLLCRRLDIHNIKRMITILIVFITWQGFDSIRNRLMEVIGIFGPGYQYTPNRVLLEWVTNQTIVPWIADLLFINERKLKNYAYLGLCVLSSAPFPFIGLFVLLAADGIYQMYMARGEDLKDWCRQACSIQNVAAVLSILPVYGLYFSGNTAANGSSGAGGFGFYIEPGDFTGMQLLLLLFFYFFQFFIITMVIGKDYKKDFLFLTLNISLFAIPVFRLGEGGDFCMRVSIPALFLLMIYTAEFMQNHAQEKLTARLAVLIAAFGIMASQSYDEWGVKYLTVKSSQSRDQLWADEIGTFSNKSADATYLGMNLHNFLMEKPYEGKFFSVLCNRKAQTEITQDRQISQGFLKDQGFCILSGKYVISPAGNTMVSITHNAEGRLVLHSKSEPLLLSNTTKPGKFEVYFQDVNQVLVFPEEEDAEIRQAKIGDPFSEWGKNEMPEKQLFEIVKEDEHYYIIWNHTYALTCDENGVFWEGWEKDRTQWWMIEPAGV